MISRTLTGWRELPHLRVRECAELAGISESAMEAYLPKLETRTIGRIRFVTTQSFRRWLGEEVGEVATERVDERVSRRAMQILKRLG